MRTILTTILIAAMSFVTASAYKYTYSFSNTPLADALVRISKDHPDINLSFIYKELDKYKTSAKIRTDNAYDALRRIVGLNPVSIVENEGNYYVEALQHGKFTYTGRVAGTDNEPVVAATVMLLSPNDSTVFTYGITDDAGRFTIPCDQKGVIGKFTCLGYKPLFKRLDLFAVGTVYMDELPIRLKAVNVEADNAFLMPDKSVYRPTQRQKNASQTATDLLARMAIPQLNARLGSSSVTTAGGESVAMYIDYVPATADDLKMMRMADVKTVEFLEYPSDARFQGNRYVVNFRMVKYEYGGYVKVLGTENFIANSGFLQANARLVKSKMTYDIMGYGYYMDNNHLGTDQTESFRLPQANGEIKSFQRESLTETSKFNRRKYDASFRALYSGDKVTANSRIDVGIDDTPHNDNAGVVKYSDNVLANSDYSKVADSNAKYISYNGYYFFSLPKNNSFTASLNYTYSHTTQSSMYSETDIAPIFNGAKDNTHTGVARLSYSQSFSRRHSLLVHSRLVYENNRTGYSGSLDAFDISTTKFGLLGASYNFTDTKVYGSLGFGWAWLYTALNDNKASANYPYFDASLSFVPNKKNKFNAVFHYSVWPPSSNYKSENVIQVSPFLWHTGNPTLKSCRSYDIGAYYTFIPSNKFNMTAYATAWLVGDRTAFVYVPTAEGIVRTIRQPIGTMRHFNYGIKASLREFDGKFYLSGNLEMLYVQNGKPFNLNRSCLSYYIQAVYYLKSFNFAVVYESKNATDNTDSMSGVWTKKKDNFYFMAGWSNTSLNISVFAQNLQRWHWRSANDVMNSEYYSVNKWVSNASSHALIQVSATYTFGYGKKVSKDNDISRQSGASSGILQ